MEEHPSQKAEQLAIDILNFVKSTLNVHFHFLQSSIDALTLVNDSNVTIATDGIYFYYDYLYILKTYKQQKEWVMRDYLHIIMHCIFHHPFVDRVNPYLWDLSCDIAVENVLNSFDDSILKNPRLHIQEPIIEEIKNHVFVLTAERIYHYLKTQNLSDERLATIRESFYHDDHSIWYQLAKEDSEDDKNQKDENNDSKQSSQNDSNTSSSSDSKQNDANGSSSLHDEDENNKDEGSLIKVPTKNNESKENWHDISESLQIDLETISKHYGDKVGELIHNLKEINHVTVDYDQFLKQFSVFKEDMKLNDDEFDYIFYTYGLKLYHNIPIIEPLEYKEDKKINEFVIAIDTSASVQGDVVKEFVSHTFKILHEKNNFFKKFHLYVIQCDTKIQDIILISNQHELNQYINQLVLNGFGGTDFRPVFEFIESKQMNHELTNLKGLLYFTDGDGLYPYKEPPYKTAFLFYNKTSHVSPPIWAIQIDLDEKSFQGGKL